jgi:hypothetical protein
MFIEVVVFMGIFNPDHVAFDCWQNTVLMLDNGRVKVKGEQRVN